MIQKKTQNDTIKHTSTANKYYSSAGHHEQKNKKNNGQIKFSAVIIKQIKLILEHSLCKNIMHRFK